MRPRWCCCKALQLRGSGWVLLVAMTGSGFAATALGQNGGSGNNNASVVQLPVFGVAVDAEGVLTHVVGEVPGGRVASERVAAARAGLPADLFDPSKLRKVSLGRLERAIAGLPEGHPPDDAMRHLAGLTELRFVFLYPDAGEIVLAGPAEGWMTDPAGRQIGVRSGRPTLLLEDLLVALRAYPPGSRENPFVGCTIGPSPDALARLTAFQRQMPRSVPQRQREQAALQIARGAREALGMANIGVFSISSQTHMAHVLIEADYRMKLMAVGLEPPPVRMTTYLEALQTPKHLVAQRWWFTPNYDCVRTTADAMGMELVGQGVQLQEEDQRIGADGQLTGTAKSSRPAQLFAQAFTQKYPHIAAASPVFAQLRNSIDLLVAAAFLREQDFYGRAGWAPASFLDESALPVETLPAPRQVACVVNAVWRGNRLLSPVGGGVSIQADQALAPDRRMFDKDGKLAKLHSETGASLPADRWWWD